MGFNVPGSGGSGTRGVPEYKPSLLETVLKPLAALDYPANIVRSGILSVSENDPSYLGEAFAGKTHSGEETLKSLGMDDPGFLASVGFETITDPLMLVGAAAGAPTKFGKALKYYGRAKRTLSATKAAESVGLNTTKQVAAATEDLLKARKVLEGFVRKEGVKIPIGKRGAKRVVTEFHVPFIEKSRTELGDFRKLKQRINKYKLLPDSRIPRLEKIKSRSTVRRTKLIEEISFAKEHGKTKVVDKLKGDLAKVEKTIAHTNNQLSELGSGAISKIPLIGERLAAISDTPIKYGRRKAYNMRKRFQRTLKGAAEETHEIGLKEVAAAEHAISLERMVLDEQVASFKRLAGETEQAFKERLILGAEYRHLARGGAINLKEAETAKLKLMKEKFKKDIGFLGELHPKVLSNFGLLVPVCAFEFDLNDIIKEKI